MKKKFLNIFITLSFVVFSPLAFAQNATPTPTACGDTILWNSKTNDYHQFCCNLNPPDGDLNDPNNQPDGWSSESAGTSCLVRGWANCGFSDKKKSNGEKIPYCCSKTNKGNSEGYGSEGGPGGELNSCVIKGGPADIETGGVTTVETGGVTTNVSDDFSKLVNPLKSGGVEDIPTLVEKILEIVLKIGTPIIALAIIYAGYLFIAAQGNPTKLETAKKTLVYVVIGAAILLGAYVIAETVVGTVNAIRGQ